MHPGLALVDSDLKLGVSPTDIEPNLHWRLSLLGD
jgi:hypothetical protein